VRSKFLGTFSIPRFKFQFALCLFIMTPEDKKDEKPNIRGDRLNIFLLINMYLLQNIVNGLIQALPLVMQNRNVSYADQVRPCRPTPPLQVG
jgi:hypothetical protein